MSIRANHLDIHQWRASACGDFAPRLSAFGYRIDTVSYDHAAKPKIAQSELIGDQVTAPPNILFKSTRISDSLLNCIDPQIYGTYSGGKATSDSRFSGTWKAAEDNEHFMSFR
jgi:hypothetical protein